MSNRDGAAFLQQELRHGFADDVAATDHKRVTSRQLALKILPQHEQAAQWGTRCKGTGGPVQKFPGILRVEAIHILFRLDGPDHPLLIDMRRHRQLGKDPVNLRILIQLVDERKNLVLRHRGVKPVFTTEHAGFGRLPALVTHVDLAGRILADQHHGETGHQCVRRCSLLTSAATVSRRRNAAALPSMMCA